MIRLPEAETEQTDCTLSDGHILTAWIVGACLVSCGVLMIGAAVWWLWA